MPKLFILAVIFFLSLTPNQAHTQSETKGNASKPYIVGIKVRSAIAAYSPESTTFGTGFIIDKAAGIIVTNAHVAGSDCVVEEYEITLYNGRELKAKPLYVDPWHDLAYLKMDPDNLKDIKENIPTEVKELKIDESVYIIGKNENKHFSYQDGKIGSLFEASEILPSQVFRISLNVQGGSSGSPVFNESGKVVGIIYASNLSSCAFAIPIAYVMDAVKHLKEDKTPPRYSSGAILDYISLDDLTRYYKLSPKVAEDYRKKFPNSFNRALFVSDILRNSPATNDLQVGDIITHVNGQEIGPNLYMFDKLFNEITDTSKPIELTIIRFGKEEKIQLTPYDLNQRKIKRMVMFGGAVFYELNDLILQRTGAKPEHRVFITNIRPGSSFYEKLPTLSRNTSSTLVAISQIEDKIIQSLDDVIELIPSLTVKKDFVIRYVNYGVEVRFDSLLFFNQTLRTQQITYSRNDGIPEVYVFDDKQLSWTVHPIVKIADLSPTSIPPVIKDLTTAKN